MQDALESRKDHVFQIYSTQYQEQVKLAVWMSGTSEQSLLHVQSVIHPDSWAVLILHMHSLIHTCKQMGINASVADTKNASENAILDVEITKGEYLQVHNSKKKMNKS